MAHYFGALGADLNGTPYWGANRPLDVGGGLDAAREALVNWLRAQGAQKSSEASMLVLARSRQSSSNLAL